MSALCGRMWGGMWRALPSGVAGAALFGYCLGAFSLLHLRAGPGLYLHRHMAEIRQGDSLARRRGGD